MKVFFLLFVLGTPAFSQLAIEWSTIDGGGGSSSGGKYKIQGTIGQTDASEVSSGGTFAIGPGFWYGVIQSPAMPQLAIERQPNGSNRIFWTDPSGIFVLQETTPPHNLQSDSFTDVPLPYQTDADESFFEITNPSGKKFFRLSTPAP
jgi:hypothetical protein